MIDTTRRNPVSWLCPEGSLASPQLAHLQQCLCHPEKSSLSRKQRRLNLSIRGSESGKELKIAAESQLPISEGPEWGTPRTPFINCGGGKPSMNHKPVAWELQKDGHTSNEGRHSGWLATVGEPRYPREYSGPEPPGRATKLCLSSILWTVIV